MHRWRDLVEVPQGYGPTVVTFGVFDGVHRGHQKVIATAVARARSAAAKPVVVTFDPHPAAVVRPEALPARLTSLDQRLELFAELGVDAAVVVAFTPERSRQPAEEFIREVVGALRPVGVVVGDDFRFGFKAAGDVALLDRLGATLGFTVTGLERGDTSAAWSSTKVRERLTAGDVAGAAAILGRPYRVDGPVVRGDQRGRLLGVPTANVPADSAYALPTDGVYAGWLTRRDDAAAVRLPAAVSVGTKPQFGPHERVIEAHVIDRTDLELYDVPVRIEFADRIRGQETFDSVETLIDTMRADIDRTRVLTSVHDGAKDGSPSDQ